MKWLDRFPALKRPNTWLIIYLVVFTAVTIHRYWLGADHYNNFTIFQWSFRNLFHGVDLYVGHPEHYYDLYKYSPTFALFMAPFSILPPLAGLLCWNLLNIVVLWLGVKRLPLSDGKKSLVVLLILTELITSVQNSQSNALMAGLMLLAFSAFEKNKPVQAALFIVLGFYIKLFALVLAALFLFYPQKGKFILWMCAWGIVFGALPVLVAGVDGLMVQYKSWLNLLAHDPAHELNYSIMTITQRWFGVEWKDSIYLVPGALLLLAPLLRRNDYYNPVFRMLMLCSILIWVVVFNHKAESPTFVIALCGATIWFLLQRKTVLIIALYIFVFVLTGLSATDLFPKFVREHYIVPYCLKVLPCIVLWIFLQYTLISGAWRRFALA